MSVSIRPYRPSDHNACRGLWAELTELQRDLYDEPDSGDTDPGVGFEDYLTRLDLSGMWVAEDSEDGVVGLIVVGSLNFSPNQGIWLGSAFIFVMANVLLYSKKAKETGLSQKERRIIS
jgi:hypothetical protein